ncbi:MAG: patatin-like phospholipase family protein [bacterium]
MTKKNHPLMRSLSLATVSLLIAFSLFLPDLSSAEEKPKRPRIGLVLGGGGAKGAAHIGVLKVLEELRIPIDCIAGTSMGAVVGSLYASGMSPDEIERVLTTVDWDDLFTDDPPRSEIDFIRKREDYTILAKMELGIRDGKLRTPRAFIEGQKIGLFFETLLMPVSDIEDFDRLPIPYRAVATDLENGSVVVLKSGRLADAARASMSVFGVFPPVEVDGHLLADGGILRNLPVDIVRAMGADIIIAVDVGKPLPPKEEMSSTVAIMNQMIDIVIKGNVDAQIDTLRDKDVFIRPDLGTIGSGDFNRGKEASERGEQAAQQHAEELRRLSVSAEEYDAFLQRQRRAPVTSIKIGSVKVEGLQRVSQETVLSKVKIKEGGTLDPETLRHHVGLIYGMGDFERVDLETKRHGDAYDITLRPKEKPWGPNYLRWGINLDASAQGNSNWNILVDYTMRWLNRLGAEWKNEVQVGTSPRLFSEFYQPINYARTFFIAPRIQWEQDLIDLYEGNDILAEYRVRTAEAGIDLGIQPWNYGEVRFGYLGGFQEVRLHKGTADVRHDTIGRGALQVRLVADQLDNVNFPHDGFFAKGLLYASREALGADDSYTKADITLLKAFTYKKYTILGSLRYGSSIGDDRISLYDQFTLGGFLNLSGYQKDQLRGQEVGFGRLVAYWRATQSLLGDFYLGGSIETGNVWQENGNASLDDLVLAGSLFIGYDTKFGPLYFGMGTAEGGNSSLYIYLGRTF